jgi:DNA-binding beta-propeller fold protein YncE
MGANARFTFPSGVAIDSSGNIYVADSGSCTIRKLTAAGVVTMLAGSPRIVWQYERYGIRCTLRFSV